MNEPRPVSPETILINATAALKVAESRVAKAIQAADELAGINFENLGYSIYSARFHEREAAKAVYAAYCELRKSQR